MKTLKLVKDLFITTILFFTLVILYGFRYNITDEEIDKIKRKWFNEK
jgi:hypothetical protein